MSDSVTSTGPGLNGTPMKSAESILNTYINNEKIKNYQNYSLNTVKALMHELGNPHENLKSIHIAGTNGKGSTAYMLNEIFIRAGYKTGLYVSPHLVRLHERISINKRQIEESVLYTYARLIDALALSMPTRPTFFDMLTAIALRYFYDEQCDICIMETGLGGRLDSTNIINPLISVITDISQDHVSILSGNLTAIAREKAGIIKKNRPVITTNRDKAVLDIIRNTSRTCGSPLLVHGKDYTSVINDISGSGISFSYSDTRGCSLPDLHIPLFQRHQATNAAAAVCAVMAVNEQ